MDDSTIMQWKATSRAQPNFRDYVYVEPSQANKILLGSIYVTNGRSNPSGVTVFELSQTNRMSLRIANEDIFLLNLVVTDTNGDELVRIDENHVKYAPSEALHYEAHRQVPANRTSN